jgi:primosomal protein N' (replication factor Y)
MVLGPTQPSVSKIKNLYIRDILCKIEKGNIDLAGIKLKLKEAIETLHLIKEYKSVFIKIDVDPQ